MNPDGGGSFVELVEDVAVWVLCDGTRRPSEIVSRIARDRHAPESMALVRQVAEAILRFDELGLLA